VLNMDSTTVEIMAWPSTDPDPTPYTLGPFESAVIPSHEASAGEPQFELEITSSATRSDIHLAVEERYGFGFPNVTAGAGETFFTGELTRGATVQDDLADFRVIGTDPDPAAVSDVLLAFTLPGAPLDVPVIGGPSAAGAGLLTSVRAAPNPFRGETRITFTLWGEAEVGAEVFDVAGRRVRTIPGIRRGPGSGAIAWDGRADGGKRAAAGVYFYRLNLDGAPAAAGKLVLRP